jgi:phosphoribosylpyrophosphate synthetase
MKPIRTTWHGFPDVIIHSPEGSVKRHTHYLAAKSGDAAAAVKLIRDVLNLQAVQTLQRALGARHPLLVSVHAQEETGVNAIPEVFADVLGKELRLDTESRIVQANVVNHTGADGFSRIARQALFAGDAESGLDYVIVDDFIGQGGTIANLKGHIESQGGHVIAAIALTGKPYSARIRLSAEQLAALRNKHGELESWWEEHFGHCFECLTQSEARYPERSPDVDTIRSRILAVEQATTGADC